MRNGPPGLPRFPRCEAVYPPPENPLRTRFLTSDNFLFDVADASVTPSLVMTKAVYYARRAAQQPLRVEPPPIPAPFSAADAPVSPSTTIPVALCNAPYKLDNVASEPLEMALTYCYFHKSAECRSMSPANITSWDDEFVRASPSQLCELASVAYYLDIRDLVDLTCRAIADIISGKTAEQIRATFHIENDRVQSLIFCQDSDAPPIPYIQSSEQRNESTSSPPNLYIDEGPDSDEQDEPRQVTETLNPPQLGRNTVEEVESWIVGDSAPKKNSKKRRKKKKNKSSTSPPENSQSNSTSNCSQCSNPSCLSPLRDVAVLERSSHSSPALVAELEGHESPSSSEKNDDCVVRDDNVNVDIGGSVSPEPTVAPVDEDVVFVSMTTPQDRSDAPKFPEKLGEKPATVEPTRPIGESTASNILPPLLELQHEPQGMSEDDQENSVWSIRSDDFSAARHEEQRNNSRNEQFRLSFQTRCHARKQYQSYEAQSREIPAPTYCSTENNLKGRGSECQQYWYTQESKDVASHQVKVESDNDSDTAAIRKGLSCIRCSNQTNKKEEDSTSQPGKSNLSTGSSRKPATNMQETQDDRGQYHRSKEYQPRQGRPHEVRLAETKLNEIRREAQLMEREKMYLQRANAIDKQIADLYSEREKVRDELSLSKMELRQLRGERET